MHRGAMLLEKIRPRPQGWLNFTRTKCLNGITTSGLSPTILSELLQEEHLSEHKFVS